MAEARQAEPYEIQQVLGDAVAAVALVGDGEAMLLPRPIEQGDDAVLEDVQKTLQCPVACSEPLGHQQGVVVGQDAQRADQPHEVDQQPRRPAVGQLEVLDLARRTCDGGIGREVRDLVRGSAESPHPRPLGVEALEETDRLEKVEGGRVARQLRGELGRAYTSGFHPALAGHSRITSFRCRVRATRIQKLFRAV